MSNIQITIKPSLEELNKKFNKLEIEQFLNTEIRKLSFMVESLAKQLTPVLTGRLRSSIGTHLQPLLGTVSTNVNYALFIHEGTSRMRPRPFMETGAKYAKQAWEGAIGQRLEQHITDKFKRL